MKSERGFVLIEFVIALPLIILLLYGLGATTLKIFSTAKNHAADYVLEVEAQNTLTRITDDLRAARSVETIKVSNSNLDAEMLTIEYHGTSNSYYKNKKLITDESKIFDILDTRVYNVKSTKDHGAYVYAQRQGGAISSPITGGNFFGDTVVTKLKYSKLAEKVLRVELELQSVVTKRKIKVSTAVFMPDCEI